MAHTARAHTGWISALVVVAITASCVTWLCVPRSQRELVINGKIVASLLRSYQNASYKAHFKVYSCEYERLAWEEECCGTNSSLDENKTWITVKDRGIYLIYLQVTYGLKKGNGSVDLQLVLDVIYRGRAEGRELVAAYETRKLTAQDQDAHLSAFLLLKMQAMEKLSVRANPVNQTKCTENEPFSSYITIIWYADWEASS